MEAAQSVAEEEEATEATDSNNLSSCIKTIINHNQIMEGSKRIKINFHNNVVVYRCSVMLGVAYFI